MSGAGEMCGASSVWGPFSNGPRCVLPYGVAAGGGLAADILVWRVQRGGGARGSRTSSARCALAGDVSDEGWLRRSAARVFGAIKEAAAEGRPVFSDVLGLRVVVLNTRPDIATSFVLARFTAAVTLIEQYQPWRLRHLRRDTERIRIATFPSRGAYFPSERTVLTELSFLACEAEFTPAQVAASILHEGVHARIHEMAVHLGFDLATRDMAREERMCRRAEIAFGGALPEAMGAAVVARAGDALALDDAGVAPEVDWREALAAKARADQEAVVAWKKNRE